jgi:hypothetical protein
MAQYINIMPFRHSAIHVLWFLCEQIIRTDSPFVRIIQMRQQKTIMEHRSMHFLAGYISMFSGLGPFQTGITRYVLP